MSLTDFLGSLFGGVAGAQDRIWNELKPWIGNLVPSAASKWLPRIAAGHICEVPRVERRAFTSKQCERPAVTACDVCHRPVCLQHGRIDQFGDAICYICVADAMTAVPPLQRERARTRGPGPQPTSGHERAQDSAPPPPKPAHSPQDISKAMEILGVKPTSTWEQVRAAHRKLSAQHHPDKQRGTRQQLAAEKKYVLVQKAFAVLKTRYPEAA